MSKRNPETLVSTAFRLIRSFGRARVDGVLPGARGPGLNRLSADSVFWTRAERRAKDDQAVSQPPFG